MFRSSLLGQQLAHFERGPEDRAILFREWKIPRRARSTDPLKHLFACGLDHGGGAPDSSQGDKLFLLSQFIEEMRSPSRIGGETEQADQCGPDQRLGVRLIVHDKGSAGASVSMEPGGYRDDVSQGFIMRRETQVPLVAGNLGSETDALFGAIGKLQLEAMILLDCRSDSSHLGIVAEIAEKMRLFFLTKIVGDVDCDVRVCLS